MGSSMWIDRKFIPKRLNEEVVSEFISIIGGRGMNIRIENDHTTKRI